ncbi:GAF domain-containing protein [Salinimicrobium sp. HB62]|uniref:GAF domain-containing protein n=1 Tax=Salinimicrobium sp. HB62 TaxID=3077781 RepID=UPI002D7799CF|nr:GAF domain-containing protein [Salinimicrobium sp. HB62]
MSKNSRLEEVRSYEVFDNPPVKELDELTELASVLFETPVSLITILDDKRQWFISRKGLEQKGTPVEDAFCKHALNTPDEVLVVNDALEDSRFKENKLVVGEPKIRFYAGAPLTTKQNHVLGTLCVIDKKSKKITREQKKALKILAGKAVDILETQKVLNNLNTSVELSTQRVVKITENIPIGIFELSINRNGKIEFLFLSNGIKKIHPNVNVEEWLDDPNLGFDVVHPEDRGSLKASLRDAVIKNKKLHHEYRVLSESGVRWHAVTGKPEKAKNGEMRIYGSFTDVTHHYEYESALEQISFDISHVLRRPVTSMLGITTLLEYEKELSAAKLREYSRSLRTVASELEDFTQKLNKIYSEKKVKIGSYKAQEN